MRARIMKAAQASGRSEDSIASILNVEVQTGVDPIENKMWQCSPDG